LLSAERRQQQEEEPGYAHGTGQYYKTCISRGAVPLDRGRRLAGLSRLSDNLILRAKSGSRGTRPGGLRGRRRPRACPTNSATGQWPGLAAPPL
jgi:hypothetical protein